MKSSSNGANFHYAWVILAGVILIRGFAGGGINMTSGLFLAPVSQDIGVGIGSLSLYLSLTSVILVLWLPFAGILINRYDIRIMAVLGAALQTLSFAAFGFMDHVAGWYVLAIPHAMGAAILVGLLGPVLINRWFSKHAGLMLGIQMAFVSLFGAVLQPLTSGIIARDGWRKAYILIGGISFLAVIFSALVLLKNRPEDIGGKPYGAGDEETKNVSKTEKTIEIPEKTAVRSASFYLLLFFMIALTGVGVFTQHIPTYGKILGYSLSAAGTALSFASVGSAIGSIAIGMISDRIGSLKTCYLVIGIGLIAAAGFLAGQKSYLVFTGASFLHGLVGSGIMVLAPILTMTFYGRADYEKIYSKVSMGAPLASIILIPVYGYVYDFTNSYFWVLIGMIGLLCLAAFCITLGWRRRCTMEGCPGWRKRKQESLR